MKFILKDGEEIQVTKEDGIYRITPRKYHGDFSYYLSNPPVVAGTYSLGTIDWLVIREIIEVRMFNRQVVQIIEEDYIPELENLPDVVY